jgi:hypothetical protein
LTASKKHQQWEYLANGIEANAHERKPEMNDLTHSNPVLLADIRQMIDTARQKVAATINAELAMLYWHIGSRIRSEILGGKRAEYGKQIVTSLAQQLTLEYGKGWGEKHLHHCLRIAEAFPEEKILYTLCREFSWSLKRTTGFASACVELVGRRLCRVNREISITPKHCRTVFRCSIIYFNTRCMMGCQVSQNHRQSQWNAIADAFVRATLPCNG